ncbi:hypothetical protein B0H11DRAFT_1912528 [Mycena galericulata]|nr:hypothetical protein B0H11DRAFT_1912528 [Mycena galericulata]
MRAKHRGLKSANVQLASQSAIRLAALRFCVVYEHNCHQACYKFQLLAANATLQRSIAGDSHGGAPMPGTPLDLKIPESLARTTSHRCSRTRSLPRAAWTKSASGMACAAGGPKECQYESPGKSARGQKDKLADLGCARTLCERDGDVRRCSRLAQEQRAGPNLRILRTPERTPLTYPLGSQNALAALHASPSLRGVAMTVFAEIAPKGKYAVSTQGGPALAASESKNPCRKLGWGNSSKADGGSASPRTHNSAGSANRASNDLEQLLLSVLSSLAHSSDASCRVNHAQASGLVFTPRILCDAVI